MNINRRRMLGGLGAATGGALLAGLTDSALAGPQHAAKAPLPASAWAPKKLDAAESALLAYDRTAHKGHNPAYGVFYGLVGQLAEKYGAPYASFPFHMLEAHDPGLVGNAAICGELQGAVSAMGLFWAAPQRNAMSEELFRWYETTALPQYTPPTPEVTAAIPPTIARSVLHHISAGKWAHVAGKSPTSQEYRERNARMAADIAFKTAELMNAHIA